MGKYLTYTTNYLKREKLNGGPKRLMEIVSGLAMRGNKGTIVAASIPDSNMFLCTHFS